jgi:hypothetical protein
MSSRVSPCKVFFLVFFFCVYTTKAIIGIARVNTIVCWMCWNRNAWSGMYLSLKATNTSESSAVHVFKTRTTFIADLVLLKTLFSCTGYVGIRIENGMARFCLGTAVYFLSIRPDVRTLQKPRTRIAGLGVAIWLQDIPNTTQECDVSVWNL